MSKQEEIREVIDLYADDGCLFPDRSCNALGSGYCSSDEEAYKCLMQRLGKIGVVIKVDRELPQDGLYLPGEFRHPNWLTGGELKAIRSLLFEPLVYAKPSPDKQYNIGTDPATKLWRKGGAKCADLDGRY